MEGEDLEFVDVEVELSDVSDGIRGSMERGSCSICWMGIKGNAVADAKWGMDFCV